MKIDLTDREIELMMMCIGTNIETIKQRHTAEGAVAELIEELFDLETDLREALHRQDDGWSDPDDPDLLMDPVDFAEKHDIDPSAVAVDAEINAETATSRAADRRALKFVPPGPLGAKGDRPAPQPTDRSEAQEHDVWEKPPNDPVDW